MKSVKIPKSRPSSYRPAGSRANDGGMARYNSRSSSGTPSVTRNALTMTARTEYSSVPDEIQVPYPVFEYGFPHGQEDLPPPPDDSQFVGTMQDGFMRSDVGVALRKNEAHYSATVRQFVTRNTQLTGKQLLVLGSGASKSMLKLIQRMPRLVVFVDVSQRAIDRVKRMVSERGLDAAVEVEYHVADAWDWVFQSVDQARFDVVFATKCLGQVLKHRGRDAYVEFCEGVADIMEPSGVLYLDHHVRLSDAVPGTPISDVVEEHEYDLATVAGRYGDDVAYSCDTPLPSFRKEASFIANLSLTTSAQSWEFFCMRRCGSRETTGSTIVRSHGAPIPVPMAAPRELPRDGLADSMIPVNSRGVKRIPTEDDLSGYPLVNSYLKFDGVSAVVIIHADSAIVVSSLRRFQVPLPYEFSINIVLSAELVMVNPMEMVIVVTGVCELGGVSMDPLDVKVLKSVEPHLSCLLKSGFLVNDPSLLQHVVKDNLVLDVGRGAKLSLAVDGIHVVVGERSGNFYKPTRFCTVDARPNEVVGLLESAYRALGLRARPSVVQGDDGVVTEYRRLDGSDEWRAVRPRPDKKRSDKFGSVVHTVVVSRNSEIYGIGGSVEEVRKKILK